MDRIDEFLKSLLDKTKEEKEIYYGKKSIFALLRRPLRAILINF